MSVAMSVLVVNHLIDELPPEERKRIMQCCAPINLNFGDILCERNEKISHVYFPLTSFISLVTTVQGHPPLEMGMIGNEGVLGAGLALGINIAPMRAVVQGAGTALQIPAAVFQSELMCNPGFRQALNMYLYALLTQISQSAACIHFHGIKPRLARWLLMTHDRAHSDHFHLTHKFLADMLGVRRSGITIAAGALQLQKLIRYSRGNITIINREGLELESCSCYRISVKDYARIFTGINYVDFQSPATI